MNINLIAALGDNNAIVGANLRKRFDIKRDKLLLENNSTLHDGIQTSVIDQNTGTLSAPTSYTDASSTYNFSYWADNFSTSNPKTISPTDNSTYTAVYKGLSRTNAVAAYTKAGARKFIKSAPFTNFPNGILHNVYESMGQIWYEASTDNGTTWQLLNGCAPISGLGNTCVSPAISSMNVVAGNDSSGTYTTVTYFQAINGSPGYYILKIFVWRFTNNMTPTSQFFTINTPVYKSSADELYAAVEMNYASRILVVYGSSYYHSLNYWFGWRFQNGIFTKETGYINGSWPAMKNPALTTYKFSNWDFHIVYQGSDNNIYYCKLSENSMGGLTQTAHQNISIAGGFSLNHDPSVTVGSDNEAKVAWVGHGNIYDQTSGTYISENTVVFRGVNSSNQVWNFDDYARQVSINNTWDGNSDGYVIGWVKQLSSTYQNMYMKSNSFYTFHNFGTTG